MFPQFDEELRVVTPEFVLRGILRQKIQYEELLYIIIFLVKIQIIRFFGFYYFVYYY